VRENENKYMAIVENYYTGSNWFKRLASNFRFWREKRKIRNMSHSIGSLWFFAEFIKLAEFIYFFDNNNSSTLYSSNTYKYGESGFMIKSLANQVNIKCKLNAEKQEIKLEISRTNGSRIINEIIFNAQKGWYNSDSSEVSVRLVDNIISIINNHIILLLCYCVEKKEDLS